MAKHWARGVQEDLGRISEEVGMGNPNLPCSLRRSSSNIDVVGIPRLSDSKVQILFSQI
jgi:hypothetical protein